jgi:EF hand
VRLTRYHLFLLGGLFLMIMGPLAFTQPGPGGGKSGKGGKGGGKGGFDPANIFTVLSGGNDTFEVAKVQLQSWGQGPTPEQQKEAMLVFLQKKGVTNGVMTKTLYVEHFQERMTEMRAQRETKGKEEGKGPPSPGGPGGRGGPPSSPEDVEKFARDSFARMDTDKNGSLSLDELKAAGKMGQRLVDELAKWDTNKNGSIELDEYIAYSKERAAQRAAGRGNPNTPTPVPEPVKPVEEDKRPIVYRTGKMPKDLPSWFEEADKDKDGQVGLYEWKASGKPVREFLAMDLNGDGFLTAEEVLRYQRATVKASTSPTLGAPSSGTSDVVAPTQGGNQRGRGQNAGPRNNGGGRNGGGRNGGAPKGGSPKGG